MLPRSAPLVLIFLSGIFLAFAFLLSPELLINLGPMRTSLTSDNSIVRSSAQTEIEIFKWVSLLCGLFFFFIYIFWSRLRNLGIFIKLDALKDPENPKDRYSPIYSFIVLAAWSLVVTYYCIGDDLLGIPFSRHMGKEDGIIESLTVILFVNAAIVCIFLVKKTIRYQDKLWFTLLSIGLIFVAGEEISWGQRIFGFETIEAIKEINVQGENNLHNLMGYMVDHVFIAGVFLFGFILPVFYHSFPLSRKVAFQLGISAPSLYLGLGFLLTSLVHSWTIYPLVEEIRIIRPGEFREFLTALCFFLYSIERWRLNRIIDGSKL